MRATLQGRLHKKSLGFFSPTAHVVVPRDKLRECRARSFALVEPERAGASVAAELRWYVGDEVSGEALAAPLEALVGNPDLGLKGVVVMAQGTQVVRAEEGFVVVTTRERTLLLCGDSDAETDAWYSALKKTLASARASVRLDLANATSLSTATTSAGGNELPTPSPTPPPRPKSAAHDQTHRFAPNSIPVQDVLADPPRRERFRALLKFSYADENLDFVEAVEALEALEPGRELVRTASQIVDRYVRESAERQVNLSSEQRRLLTTAMDNATDAGDAHAKDQAAFVLEALRIGKAEILDLMRRNFLGKFLLKERDEEERARQRAMLSGCFAQLWRTHGLDAYVAVMSFAPALQGDAALVNSFLSTRVDRAVAESDAAKQLAAQFKTAALVQHLPSLAKAIRAVLDTLDVRVRSLTEFADEVRMSVLGPMLALQKDVDSVMKQVSDANEKRVAEMLKLRAAAKKALDAETAAFRVAEAEAAGANAPPQAGAKAVKKTQSNLSKLEKDKAAASEARVAAEVALVSAESVHAGEFLAVMDQLQSLFLHRCDTIQTLLTRAVLAEQTYLSRLELRLSGAIGECTNVDSHADLVAFADAMSKRAKEERRRMSVAAPPSAGAGAGKSPPKPAGASGVPPGAPVPAPLSSSSKRGSFFW